MVLGHAHALRDPVALCGSSHGVEKSACWRGVRLSSLC